MHIIYIITCQEEDSILEFKGKKYVEWQQLNHQVGSLSQKDILTLIYAVV